MVRSHYRVLSRRLCDETGFQKIRPLTSEWTDEGHQCGHEWVRPGACGGQDEKVAQPWGEGWQCLWAERSEWTRKILERANQSDVGTDWLRKAAQPTLSEAAELRRGLSLMLHADSAIPRQRSGAVSC